MAIVLTDERHNVEYLPFDIKRIPFSYNVKLNGKTFTFSFKYNDEGGFFTCDLATYRGEVLALGDIVRYGRPMFGMVSDERFPDLTIIPKSYSGDNEDEITFENMGRTVKLYIHGVDESA